MRLAFVFVSFALAAALFSTGCNKPPAAPAVPVGPDSGRANSAYSFSAVTTDPEAESVAYQFDWGDNRYSAWTSYAASGAPGSLAVSWRKGGVFAVRARARDQGERESDWSAAHEFRVAGDGTIRWDVSLGGNAAGAPVAVGDNIVFPVAGGMLVCLDTSGEDAWSVTLPDEINGTPAADSSGRVFVTCANARVYAYDADGAKAWERLVGFGCFAPAIGPDGRVYTGATDGRLYALDPADGRILGFYQAGDDIRAPCVARPDGVIIFGCDDGGLYAVNPDFSLRWRYTLGGNVRQSPALGEEGRVYIGSDDNRLYAIDSAGGLLWTYETEADVKGEPAVGPGGEVWFGSDDNRLYRLDRDGALVRSFTCSGFVRACPSLAANGRAYLGSYDGMLYALDDTSAVLWEVEGDGAVLFSPLLAPDGSVYFMAGGTAYGCGGQGGPADSPWPTGRHDARRSGRLSSFQWR